MSIELEQLRQIMAIKEFETLSSAANELHLSQPALSRSVKRMEEDLCVTLFTRTKNKMSLNHTGYLFAEYAQRILDLDAEMIRSVRDYDRSCRTIAIGTCAPAPVWYLLPVISSLFPEMAVSTKLGMTEDILKSFHKGLYQLAIVPYPIHQSNLVCSHLIDEQLYFALPKDHPLASSKGLHLSDLDGETMLLYSGIGFWYHMHKVKMPHTRFLMQHERETFNEIARSSSIPCFASDLGIRHDHSDSGRVIIPILDKESHASFYCICHKDDYGKYQSLFQNLPIS